MNEKLKAVFGSEWTALLPSDKDNIARDYAGALQEDGTSAETYRRNIGVGNLATYAQCMRKLTRSEGTEADREAFNELREALGDARRCLEKEQPYTMGVATYLLRIADKYDVR